MLTIRSRIKHKQKSKQLSTEVWIDETKEKMHKQHNSNRVNELMLQSTQKSNVELHSNKILLQIGFSKDTRIS